VLAASAVRSLLTTLALLATLGVTACGDDESGGLGRNGERERQVEAASKVAVSDFPATRGRTLQTIADTIQAGPQVGRATSVLVPGWQRLAFGMIGRDQGFLYGKSALYVAQTPESKARGPFPAPADSLLPRPSVCEPANGRRLRWYQGHLRRQGAVRGAR
jgi:hypothetical protein